MKGIGSLTIDFKYTIFKSDHVYDTRGPSKFTRDEFITDKIYEDIIRVAIKYGLTSFRGKGPVVIRFHDFKMNSYGILVEINEKREISIITVYRKSARAFYNSFIKAKNEVNLWNYYTLPRLSKTDKISKKYEILERNMNKEFALDYISFQDIMRKSGVKTL